MNRHLIATLLLCCTMTATADNLLKNADFKEGTQHWTIPASLAPGPHFDVKDGVLHWQSEVRSGYLLASQQIPLTPGRVYRISGMVKTEKLAGAQETGASICMGYLNTDGKHVNGGPYPGGFKGTSPWNKITAYTGPIPDDVVSGSFTCYVRKNSRKKEHFSGQAWWKDLRVEPVPFLCRILKPHYKLNIDNTLELEFETYPEDYRKTFADCEIILLLNGRNDGKTIWEQCFSPTQRLEHKSFQIDIPDGQYTLVARLMSNREILWEDSFHLQKNPALPKVLIDRNGRTIVDGKAFFPLGIYTQFGYQDFDAFIKDVELLKISGINTVQSYSALDRRKMDALHEAGLKVVFSIKDAFSSIWFCPREIKNIHDEVPYIGKVVNRWKNHPALLAWYVNDELTPAVLDSHRMHYDAINRLDFNHPSWNLHCVPSETTEYINCADVIGCDSYPVPKHPIRKVYDDMSATVGFTRNARSLWAVVNISDETGQTPTTEELRNMSYQALCAGAKGLFFYAMHRIERDKTRSFSDIWQGVHQVSLELKGHLDILLSDETPPLVKTTGEGVVFLPKRLGKKLYVFAVNTDDKNTTVTLEAPGISGKWSKQTIGGENGSDSPDHLKGLETALYSVDLEN